MKKQIKDLARKLIKYLRHKKFRKIKVKNEDVTILCNCCIGGTMYNDLGLRFLSPTVNLFFGHHGFIDFVNHLDEYEGAELIKTEKFDINEHNVHSPVCILRKNGLPDVEIHFLHYDSYDEAVEKWNERYKRINRDKIFLVIEAMDDHEHELIDEYVNLPYPKIIFTDLPSNPDKCLMHMSVYDKYDQNKKSVTGFINVFGKRGYDEFDFVNTIFNKQY